MGAPDGITVRHFRDGDLDEAVALLDLAFGGWPRRDLTVSPAEHLRWKLASHERAAFGRFVAEADGRIVGTHFYFIQDAVLAGRAVTTACGADSSVHPDYRGRHVFTAMREASYRVLEQHFDLRYSRGAHVAVNRARDRRGEPVFGDTVEVLKLSLRGWRPLLGRIATRPGAVAGDGVESVSCFEDAVETLWERSAPAFAFSVARTRERLDWRYADARGGPSVIRIVRDGSEWRGFAALRWTGTGGHLSDILVLPGDGDALGTLLESVASAARERGLRAVRAWMPGRHPYRQAFLAAGFRPTGEAVDLRYEPLIAPADEVALLGEPTTSFHVTLGDTDAG